MTLSFQRIGFLFMPELPEVETIKNQLNRVLVGRRIQKIEVFLPKIVKTPLPQFKKAVGGSIIKKIRRRAKILIFELSSGWSMLFHLKLTGQLIYQKKDSPQKPHFNKHTHLIFYLSDKAKLLFNDVRQFGYIKIIKTAEIDNFFKKEKIGPEPLSRFFSFDNFKKIIAKKTKTKIKQFLMDQKNLAGIGNIYSDEILFAAGVNPLRPISQLKEKEIEKIFLNIKKILSQAIKYRGTSSNDYLDAFGREGAYLKYLAVYGQEGKNCVKCKQKIKRIKIGGRSAHFCPICQK